MSINHLRWNFNYLESKIFCSVWVTQLTAYSLLHSALTVCFQLKIKPNVHTRGGVEDTRPRTQKNPRPRPRSRTALSRTDSLEAKDRNARAKVKNQGHKRKCSPKKKRQSSKNVFRRFPVKNAFWNFFSGDLQNCNNSKKSAVLEPRTGQFSRTWGLEVKAKDLTFEAKDFKMGPRGRPRGQGRPRGLHLW